MMLNSPANLTKSLVKRCQLIKIDGYQSKRVLPPRYTDLQSLQSFENRFATLFERHYCNFIQKFSHLIL